MRTLIALGGAWGLLACGGAQHARSFTTTRVVPTMTDGTPFTGGLNWTMTMDCGAGRAFTLESDGYVRGEWMIKWPHECDEQLPTITLNLRPSWMHCDPINGLRKVVHPGEDFHVELTCTDRPQE